MTKRRIKIAELQVGMYVTELDRSWFRTPFLRHCFMVNSTDEIDSLRQSGIREVVIDPSRGLDVPSSSETVREKEQCCEPAPTNKMESTSSQLLKQDFRVAKEARNKLERTVHCLFDNIGATGAINVDEAHEAAQEIVIVTRTLTNPAIFMAMSHVRENSSLVSDHALATCTFSMILGQAMGLDLVSLQELAMGALLHDIGLVRIPPPLLRRLRDNSNRVSPRERALYEAHAKQGAVELERQGGFSLEVRRVVAEHHALLNGRGFPSEIHPQWISAASQIVMVADQYDELLTGFGVRTPAQPHEALHRLYRLAQEGALDQNLTSLFIKRVGVFPIYSMVELNTGERGVIAELNADHLQLPVIFVTHTEKGEPLATTLRVDLLHQDHAGVTRSIARVLASGTPDLIE